MSRRFQFSLVRSLAAIGLICVALALGHFAADDEVNYLQPLLLAGVCGIAIAASLGLLLRKTLWLVLGAAIGAAACICYDGYITSWFNPPSLW